MTTSLAFLLLAADLSGTWIAERIMPNGMKRETVYKLRQEGLTLTGSMTAMMGELPIRNGKIEGDTFTFETVMDFGGEERVMKHEGKILGDKLEIRTVGGMFGPPPGKAPPKGAPGPLIAVRLTPEMERARDAARPKISLPAIRDLPPNGLALTPPMGWNSWNAFRTKIDDKTIREIAGALVKTGMRDAGYRYLIIDDGWQGRRGEDGVLRPNERFPDMKALADYVRLKGLKFGIYSSPGPRTCGGFEGSFNHEEQDARMFAAWGVDYLKYDWCSAGEVYKPSEMRAAYQKMAEALRATKRPVVYAICQYGRENVHEWGPKAGGNLWRTTFDIRDTWQSMSGIGFRQNGLEKYAGPGHWNDPDMLEVGNGGMTATEYRTHFTLWAMLAAPLLAGNDVRSMSEETRSILLNREVIAVNQDKLGRQGARVVQDGSVEVWTRQLSGAMAVAVFNRGENPAAIKLDWRQIGAGPNPKIRDLWAGKDLPRRRGGHTVDVPPHGVVLLRVTD